MATPALRPINSQIHPVVNRFDEIYLGEMVPPDFGDITRKDDEYHINIIHGGLNSWRALLQFSFGGGGTRSLYLQIPPFLYFEWRVTGPADQEDDTFYEYAAEIWVGYGNNTVGRIIYADEVYPISALAPNGPWKSVSAQLPFSDVYNDNNQDQVEPINVVITVGPHTRNVGGLQVDTLELRNLFAFNMVSLVDPDFYPGWGNPSDPNFNPGIPGQGPGSIVWPQHQGEPGGPGGGTGFSGEFGPMSRTLTIPRKTWPIGDPIRLQQVLEQEGVRQAEPLAKAWCAYFEQWALDEEDNYREIETWASTVRPTLEE